MGAMQQWLVEQAIARQNKGIQRRADVAAAPLTAAGSVVDLAANDYLGLAGDPRLHAAAIAAIQSQGTSARASRVVTGTQAAHLEFERAITELTGQPSALTFSSGYLANLGAVTALGGEGTLILTDQHIHASLIDAARLARGVVQPLPHLDLEALEVALATRTVPRALVIIESVYSVFGDAADIKATADLCARYDALLLVDEAHGVGVLGDGGGGVRAVGLAGAEHVVVTATLSKALGAQGGVVLGSPMIREHLVNSARTFIFDTGLAPAAAASAAEACRIIAAEPERRLALHRNAAILAAASGRAVAPGAVQSIPVASSDAALRISDALRHKGILVGCFRPPSVPDGVSRLRMCANAALPVPVVTAAADAVVSAITADTPVTSGTGR